MAGCADTSRRGVVWMHVTLLVLLPAFAWLTWWQLERALGGNTLSWAYTFEWPLFAVYAIYVWWQLIHDQTTAVTRRLQSVGRRGTRMARTTANRAGPSAGAGRKNVAIAASSVIDEERGGRGERFAPQTAEEAEELAEYNRYLAELRRSRRRVLALTGSSCAARPDRQSPPSPPCSRGAWKAPWSATG